MRENTFSSTQIIWLCVVLNMQNAIHIHQCRIKPSLRPGTKHQILSFSLIFVRQKICGALGHCPFGPHQNGVEWALDSACPYIYTRLHAFFVTVLTSISRLLGRYARGIYLFKYLFASTFSIFMAMLWLVMCGCVTLPFWYVVYEWIHRKTCISSHIPVYYNR